MRIKHFNQRWHDSNDPQSRLVVIEYMRSVGFDFRENPDKYGIDLFSCFKDPMIAIEVEHRSIWDREKYPYPSVSIPARKAKFLFEHVAYVVLNKDFTRMGVALYSRMAPYLNRLIGKANNAIKDGSEMFYHVPVECFKWVALK